jgi:hypothetical protein
MWSTQRECLHHRSPQSLVGNVVHRDESEPRPSARILRKWEKSQLCMQERLTEREDLEGRLAGGGWQLEACWGGGTSLWASEGVVFSRIGGSGKAAQILEEGNGSWGGLGRGRPGEQGQCWERTLIWVTASNVRKKQCRSQRKLTRKVSCP